MISCLEACHLLPSFVRQSKRHHVFHIGMRITTRRSCLCVLLKPPCMEAVEQARTIGLDSPRHFCVFGERRLSSTASVDVQLSLRKTVALSFERTRSHGSLTSPHSIYPSRSCQLRCYSKPYDLCGVVASGMLLVIREPSFL